VLAKNMASWTKFVGRGSHHLTENAKLFLVFLSSY